MLSIVIAIVVCPVFLVCAWQFFNWVWLNPRKVEMLFRQQGMKGNPYRFLYGDSKETSSMYQKSHAKAIGLNDDITPRIMPNILHAIQKYGNFSFSWSGPRPRVFIVDSGLARDVLNKHHMYSKTFRLSSHIARMLFGGIGDLEGYEWVHFRARLNPIFHMDKLKPMVPAIQSCTEEALGKWREMTTKEGGSCLVDTIDHLQIFTSEVLAQLMFTSPYTERIKKTFLELSELGNLAKFASKILSIPGEQYLPTRINRRCNEIDRHAREVFTSMIHDRLSRKKPEATGHRDLLDVFITDLYDDNFTKESDRKKVIENAIGNCKIFFFAGFETNSNTLTWALILLSFHQEWQVRARDEVFQVLGNEKKEITNDDLGKLKIVTMIVNEILRLYPPAMEISRVANEDTKISEYTIPKGTVVTFPVLMLHRSKEIWGEDALEFNPGRFSDGVLKAANGEAAFIPFGWGPRICVGTNFAMMEAKTFLAMVLREFYIEPSPTYTHAPTVSVTIQPQFGAPVVLRKIQPSVK